MGTLDRIALRLSALLLVALVSSCKFDTTLPAAAEVRCTTDAQCPAGYRCATDFQLCEPNGQSPGLLSSSVTVDPPPTDRAYVRAGDTVALTVIDSKPYVAAPRAWAVLETQRAELTLVDHSDTEAHFTFAIDPAYPEGIVAFQASAVDVTNVRPLGGSLSTTVIIDNTPPTLQVADSTVSARSVRAAGQVAILARFSEPVRDGVALHAREAATGQTTALTALSNQNGLVAYTFAPAGGSQSSYELEFVAAEVQDLAGNTLTGPVSLGTVTVDTQPPVITAPGLQGRHFSALPGHNTVSFLLAMDDPAATAQVCLANQPCRTARSGDTVTFTVTTADPEGPAYLVVTATDVAGNVAQGVVEQLFFDFTAPHIVGQPVLELSAPPGCPLLRVSSLGPGATARVFFSIDEPVVATPTVSAGAFTLAQESAAPTSFTYAGTLAVSLPDGPTPLTATLVDDVGNAATQTVMTLTVDSTRPATLTPTQLAGVTYQRIPWGADESGDVPRYSVVATAGTLAPGETLVVWDAAATATGGQLGLGTAAADGSLPRLELTRVDHPQVYLQRFDGACNADSATATAVKRIEYVASVRGPNSLEVRPLATPASVLAELPQADPALLQTRNGQPLVTKAAIGWVPARAPQVGLPTPTTVLGLAYDAARRRTVMFANGPRSTWEYDGTAWSSAGVVSQPATRYGTALVYDAGRNRVVLFGGAADPAPLSPAQFFRDTWEYDGTGWSQINTPSTPQGRMQGVLSYDSVRRRVVLQGGWNLLGPLPETWDYDGTDWVPRTASGGPVGGGVAMAFDPGRAVTVAFQSGVTMQYDGTSWSAPAAAGVSSTQPQLFWDAVRGRISLLTETGALWDYDGTSRAFTAHPTPVSPGPGPVAFDSGRGRAVVYDSTRATWDFDGSTWSKRTASVPALSSAAVAFDAARSKAVLFGGQTAAGLSPDTWEYDGTAWTLDADSGRVPPSARAAAAVAYDPVRRRTVLFGGSAGSALGDTWELAFGQWARVTPATSPPARSGHAMAFDAARGRVVLFGGLSAAGVALNDTWEFDGTTWVLRAGAGPGARSGHAMAWDPVRSRLVLFGGVNGGPLGDTWELGPAGWAQVSTLGPAPRSGAGLAYLAPLGVVLFGGQGATALNDTWTWSGSAWAQLTPAASPPVRANPALVADAVRGRLVLYGGSSGAPLADTWEFTGTTWFVKNLTQTIGGRNQAGAAYDVDHGRGICFGGAASAAVFIPETAAWDGDTWTVVNNGATPPSPSARSPAGVAYDSVRHVTVLFGGRSPLTSDTWEFNGSVWALRTLAAAPAPRFAAQMAFDASRGVTVLFGGVNAASVFGDTWEYDGATWRQKTTATTPPARTLGGMVYDASRRRVVMFGGTASLGSVMGDLWEYDGIDWAQRTLPSMPPARSDFAMAFDVLRGRATLFGGVGIGGAVLDDTWELDGATWTRLTTSPRPLLRSGAAMFYDSRRGRAVMYGGVDDANNRLGDVWEAGLPPDVGPQQVLRFDCAAFALPAGATVNQVTPRLVSGGASGAGPGVSLGTWTNQTLGALASNLAPDSAPDWVSATIDNPALASLCPDGQLRVAVTSLSGSRVTNGVLSSWATVATDYAELRVLSTAP